VHSISTAARVVNRLGFPQRGQVRIAHPAIAKKQEVFAGLIGRKVPSIRERHMSKDSRDPAIRQVPDPRQISTAIFHPHRKAVLTSPFIRHD